MNINNKLSKCRTELMGCAMISILVFHYFLDVKKHADALPRIVYRIACVYNQLFNSVGVEIFLLLSGMGLVYSFTKKPLIQFYRKRAFKVLLPYLLLGSADYIIQDMILSNNSQKFLKDLFFVTFFTDRNRHFWYICCILLFYLIFPVIYWIIAKSKYHILSVSGIILADIVMNEMIRSSHPTFFHNIEIMLLRFPIFVVGVYTGCQMIEQKEEKAGKFKYIFLLLVCTFFIKCYDYKYDPRWFRYVNRYLNGVFAFSLTCCGGLALEGWSSVGRKVFAFFGKYSLELYITHVSLRKIMTKMGYSIYRPKTAAVLLILSILISVVFHQTYEYALYGRKKGMKKQLL